MNTTSPQRPVIGISGSNSDSKSVRAMMQQIADAGAIPLLLAKHDKRSPAQDIDKIDALVVMGNDADINPSEYGQQAHPKTVIEKDQDRAIYERVMLATAIDRKMPVLGVCGGLQRINVLCGGTLHQHVPDLVGHNEHSQQAYDIAPTTPVQPIILAKGTKLADIAKDITAVFSPTHAPAPPSVILENSMHHQAVAIVGEGLRPTAFAEDKVKLPDGRDSLLIEGVEADPNGKFGNQFLMGVQWHPEFGASPLGERIAAHFAGAAQEYAQANNRTHPADEAAQETALSTTQKEQLPPRPGSMTEMILRQRAVRNASLGMAI